MKSYTLIVLAVSFLSTSAIHAQIPGRWYRVDINSAADLRAVVAVPPSTFVAVGGNGAMLRSSNNGRTWSQHSGTASANVAFLAVDANSDGAVVAVADDGTVASGMIFGPLALQQPARSTGWAAVAYSDKNVVLIAGRDSAEQRVRIMRSTNNGDSFERVAWLGGDVTVVGMRFVSPTLGFIVGAEVAPGGTSSGVVYRTTDGGSSWNKVSDASGFELLTTIAAVGNDLVAAGITTFTNGGILRSTNDGLTWQFESESDLSMVGSLQALSSDSYIASGVRMTTDVSGEDVMVFTTTFLSADSGRSWNIADVEDGFFGLTSIAATANHIVMVGDSGRVWTRWYEPVVPASIERLVRHVEFGTARTVRDTLLERVVVNSSASPLFVRQARIAGGRSLSLVVDPVGTTLLPGQALDLHLQFEPIESGDQWSAVVLTMSDGNTAVVHTSATAVQEQHQSCMAQVAPVSVLYESFSPLGEDIYSGELFVNTTGSQRVVRSIRFEGGDNVAFHIADPESLPYDLESQESFGCMVRFAGFAPGVYRSTMVIETDTCVVRVPIVGYVRMRSWQDIVSMPGVVQNSASRHSVYHTSAEWYRHATADAEVAFDAPFRLVDAEAVLEGEWTKYRMDVECAPLESGLVVSRCDVPWVFDDGRTWTSRAVLVANVRPSDPTSVDERAAKSLLVYPNPVRASMNVKDAQASGWVWLRVLDLQGGVVARERMFCDGGGLDIVLAAHEWAPGMYQVEVSDAQGLRRQAVLRIGE